jgi:hypothetical protein
MTNDAKTNCVLAATSFFIYFELTWFHTPKTGHLMTLCTVQNHGQAAHTCVAVAQGGSANG